MISLLCGLMFCFFLSKDLVFWSHFLQLDSGVAFMILIFPFILFLVISPPFSSSSTMTKIIQPTIFFVIIFFLGLSFSSSSGFWYLLYLEVCVIFIMLFIFFFSKDSDKTSSSIFMFVLNMAPSFLFMFFCVLSNPLSLLAPSDPEGFSSLMLFFFFLGLLASKLPLFLFHFWLTKAHVSASGPGSMVLASLLLKIGGMGLYKFSQFLCICSKKFSSLLPSFGLVGLILIFLVMTRFVELKFLVACSSVTHMSPIFFLLLKGDPVSMCSSFLMMVGHGIISYFIFFLVSLAYEISQSKTSYFSKSLESLSSSLGMFMMMFFILNMGFPPFMSFVSELFFSFLCVSLSFWLGVLFLFGLLLSGMVFFLVGSKLIYGKKSVVILSDSSVNLILFSYSFLFLFTFSFLFYS